MGEGREEEMGQGMGALPTEVGRSAALRVEPASLSQAKPAAANADRCGGHFDPFADVRMGRSLFDMRPQDWIDKSGCQYCDGYCHGGCRD